MNKTSKNRQSFHGMKNPTVHDDGSVAFKRIGHFANAGDAKKAEKWARRVVGLMLSERQPVERRHV